MIYLDHNATTPAHVQVTEMVASLIKSPYNASSVHANGREAKAIIEEARNRVAALLNIDVRSQKYQIIFTSSGTEANNMIIAAFKDADIFVSAIEHLSILALREYFPNIKVIKVDNNGLVDINDLEHQLSESKKDKKLISVMLANNETGVVQQLEKIVEVARKFNALVHSDIVQAVGKIEVDLPKLGIDFATISAHKFGGISGAAALIVRTEHKISPMIIGGGQERGMRASTENVPAIAAMGLAAEIISLELPERQKKMKDLQSRLENALPRTKIVGQDILRLPNTTLVIANSELDAMTQLIAFDLKGFAVSSGAACSSGKVGSSHVLKAMGFNETEIKSAIRVSFSPTNSFEEVDSFIEAFKIVNSK